MNKWISQKKKKIASINKSMLIFLTANKKLTIFRELKENQKYSFGRCIDAFEFEFFYSNIFLYFR